MPGESTSVDLSKFVRGEGAELADVVSEQSECNTPDITGLKARFTVEGGTLCRYNFTVRNGRSQARAMLSLLASAATTPILAPLSHAMVLDPTATPPQTASFDLVTLLGADFPTGAYALDAASVAVDGGTSQGTTSVVGNIITYTPPTSADWNRISFVLKDPAQPTKDVLGSIYVTVADRLNQAPTIAKPKYDYVTENPTAPIYNMESATLNLGTLPNLNIVDPDGDTWDIEDVSSHSATVTKSGKNITFTGATGNHIVSYLVRDNKGGFRMGLINVNVVYKERTKDWVDITIGDKTFFATPIYSEVIAKGLSAGAFWDTGVNTTITPPGNTIATVTGAIAKSYCAGSGYRLATQSNLDLLRTTASASASLAKYPKAQQYAISNDGINYNSYNLSTGAVSSASSLYVICVKYSGDGRMSYSPLPNTPIPGTINTVVSSDTSGWTKIGTVISAYNVIEPITVTSVTNAGNTPLSSANFRLSPAGCAGGTCSLEVKAASDAYGLVSIKLESSIDASDTITISPVTFWRNIRLSALTITTDHSQPNGSSKNIIYATFSDKDNNPIPAGTSVPFKYAKSESITGSGATISPANNTNQFVDSSGRVKLELTATKGVRVTINMPEMIDFGIGSTSTKSIVSTFDTPCAITIGTLCFSKIDIYRHNWTNASIVCGQLQSGDGFGWGLPWVSDLQLARGSMLALGWPSDYYWTPQTVSGTTHYSVNITDGSYWETNDANGIYVTCLRHL